MTWPPSLRPPRGHPAHRPGLRALPAGRDRRARLLLVLDEVVSFRLGYGGLQGLAGIRPDLTILGKIIGGGFPVGAFGGRADLMDLLDELGGPHRVLPQRHLLRTPRGHGGRAWPPCRRCHRRPTPTSSARGRHPARRDGDLRPAERRRARRRRRLPVLAPLRARPPRRLPHAAGGRWELRPGAWASG